MKKVKNDLQAVTKEFKALRKKVGQLTSKLGKTAVEELDHVQTRVKLKSPAQYAADALKSLTRETDKLVKAVDKFEKETAAKTKKAKVQAQAKTRKKGASKKKPVAKKAKAVTATDEVLNIVRRSKKGIDVQTLVKKTGLAPTTVRNIVSRAAKQGKIKRVNKGIYARA